MVFSNGLFIYIRMVVLISVDSKRNVYWILADEERNIT